MISPLWDAREKNYYYEVLIVAHPIFSFLSSNCHHLQESTMTDQTQTAILDANPLENVWNLPIHRIDFNQLQFPNTYHGILGQGSYGAVYAAYIRDENHQLCSVAVKVMKCTPQTQAEGIIDSVIREIQKLHKLNSDGGHPNIIRLYAYFTPSHLLPPGAGPLVPPGANDVIGFVMERAQYGSLLNVLNNHKSLVTWRNCISWLRQVASGLAYMHAWNEKHKDVKPENILVMEDLSIRLSDFGLTMNHGRSKSAPKSGTIQYMAPEVIRGEASDFASDMYSFGITAGCLLTVMNPPERTIRNEQRFIDWLNISIFANVPDFNKVLQMITSCVRDLPSQRPNADQVAGFLQEIEQQS